MPIYRSVNGNWKKTVLAYANGSVVPQIYYGSKLIHEMKAIFESNIPGTYNIKIPVTGYYNIKLVGGGGGGHTDGAGYHPYNYGGGSGAYVYGTKRIEAGVYTIVVGRVASGNTKGGDSTFDGEIAGGGFASTNGGGIATTTLSYINGNNGGFGNIWEGPGGASVYNGYGTGMTASNGDLSGGTSGYALVEFSSLNGE